MEKSTALFPMHRQISYSCFIWIFGLGLFLFIISHNLLNNHYDYLYHSPVMNQSTELFNSIFFLKVYSHLDNSRTKNENTGNSILKKMQHINTFSHNHTEKENLFLRNIIHMKKVYTGQSG